MSEESILDKRPTNGLSILTGWIEEERQNEKVKNMMPTTIESHGILWVLNGKELECPECGAGKQHMSWNIFTSTQSKITSAECKCGFCNCVFRILRAEGEE